MSKSSAGENSGMPNLFAPNVQSDPAIKDQHRKIVEALELTCAQERLHCQEAAAARESLNRREER